MKQLIKRTDLKHTNPPLPAPSLFDSSPTDTSSDNAPNYMGFEPPAPIDPKPSSPTPSSPTYAPLPRPPASLSSPPNRKGGAFGRRSQNRGPFQKRGGGISRYTMIGSLLALALSVFALLTSLWVDEGNTTTIIREVTPASPIVQNINTSDGSIADEATIVDAAARLIDTAVGIVTEDGSGSGFFYDESGLIMTAAHVITNEFGELYERVTVIINQGNYRLEGEVLGADQLKDIAVVKVDLNKVTSDITFRVANLAVDTQVVVGQDVIAIGNPFGLEYTVTTGIVSAVNRTVLGSNQGEVLGFNLIQTDTPINSGNSGGLLANINGEVVGVNILIYSPNGFSGNVGVGFAVPIAQAKDVADNIVAGTARRELGYIGLVGRSATIGKAGALVVDVVPGEAASLAGVQVGDLIVEADGREILSFTDLLTVVQLHNPNDEFEIVVLRGESDPDTGEIINGETLELSIVLGSVSS